MFNYFGSKHYSARLYPHPIHNTIIEPFAGSARYALYFSRIAKASMFHEPYRVILNDLYDVVYNIWDYLIHASRDQILNLPELKQGQYLDEFDLLEVEKKLLGFAINIGGATPSHVCTEWGEKNRGCVRLKRKILRDIGLVRDWTIIQKDYRDLENIEATWYIDPPYYIAGHQYKQGSKGIDYEELAEWCMSRKGQVIVCENEGAEWLPFKPFGTFRGLFRPSVEVIWYREKSYPYRRIKLHNRG